VQDEDPVEQLLCPEPALIAAISLIGIFFTSNFVSFM
jgi:hypothetical protein